MNHNEHQQRRAQLMRKLGTGSLVILPTAPEQKRNQDVHYPFRPDSDFYYLTGFAEPQAWLILAPGRADGESLLFCRDKDPQQERWEGYRTGPTAAVTEYGMDQAFPATELDQQIPALFAQAERIYFDWGFTPETDQRMIDWITQARATTRGHNELDILALSTPLHDLRLRKSVAEISTMRRAAALSAEAHQALMRQCQPGCYEYQLAALFHYHCQQQGASELAYPSIVGGGENACVLHYTANQATLQDGDLVLIDAGCELDFYASDITRTFPVNGRFSPPQRALYEWVLAAQQAAVDQVRPGNRWDQPHHAAVEVLTEGMLQLGLLHGSFDQAIQDKTYQRFYMHKTSHWLGMDVHDVGTYHINKTPRQLETGMVLTVEPGLYIPRGSEGIDEQWQGIGIRIEDDVVVGTDTPEVLSQDAPKTVEAIEAMMASKT